MTDTRDLIIIGGGPAGYTAALYAARANLAPLVIEGFNWGGRQAERFGAEFVTDDVTRVDFTERPFRIWVEGDEHKARTVIIATGASARWLGLPGETQYQGRGVSACATCDGSFFRDKELIVVGGGDTAMEEAAFLTRFATKVTVVHRRDDFRASQIMLDRARANDKIEFLANTVIDEILGDGKVQSVRLRDVQTDETWEMSVDGVFVAIGHDPNTKLFVDQLDHDAAGYLITAPGTTETNIRGVFAAGDVQDHTYRQAVTAAGSGCMAALDAERLLAEEEGHEASAATAPRAEAAEV